MGRTAHSSLVDSPANASAPAHSVDSSAAARPERIDERTAALLSSETLVGKDCHNGAPMVGSTATADRMRTSAASQSGESGPGPE